MRQILSSPRMPLPKFRYSPCVKAGPWYHFAGLVALDLGTGKLVLGDCEVQTRQILRNFSSALPDFGITLDHLVSATIFTTQFDQFPLINKAWEEVFTVDQLPPARSAVGVAALPLGALVEIEFRAYKEER